MVSRDLIEKAREFHGHICPFLILGLRIAELGVKRAGVVETMREGIVAIIEVNNSLSDGIQVANGFTLGNNFLILVKTLYRCLRGY